MVDYNTYLRHERDDLFNSQKLLHSKARESKVNALKAQDDELAMLAAQLSLVGGSGSSQSSSIARNNSSQPDTSLPQSFVPQSRNEVLEQKRAALGILQDSVTAGRAELALHPHWHKPPSSCSDPELEDLLESVT
ncbi:hypothetical protein HGRIS_000482 [Hohenbuehelia grisea]|uniref:Uncharacterized protein n=1 Tax=Hohenbuehelia grisea TaxID=104357 RepID=A0ABR3JT77_9AGAR